MKTDRELLELAAKAAGMSNLISFGFDSSIPYWLGDPKQPEPRYWNPLTNDGDALRLLTKLKLSIESDALIEVDFDKDFGGTYEYGCEVWFVHPDGETTKSQVLYGDDPGTATRRAIVQAAAELITHNPK